MQERRKVEEQYVQGLRRLMQFKSPNAASELGYIVFINPPFSLGVNLHSPDC
jgi:hypothetical protein